MSTLLVILVVCFASVLGLLFALALARALLYANVLIELDENARWLVPAAHPRATRQAQRLRHTNPGPVARDRELRKSAVPV